MAKRRIKKRNGLFLIGLFGAALGVTAYLRGWWPFKKKTTGNVNVGQPNEDNPLHHYADYVSGGPSDITI